VPDKDSSPIEERPTQAGPSREVSVGTVATRYVPEIVLGFVAPTGIRFAEVQKPVAERLRLYGYGVEEVRLSSWLSELAGMKDELRPEVRIPALQRAGDLARTFAGSADALAHVAIREIADRRTMQNEAPPPKPKETQLPAVAYVVWSLKHKREVELLRQIYGSRFSLFSVYSPREARERQLAEAIAAASRTTRPSKDYESRAKEIIDRDEYESLPGNFGQNVRGAYPLADFFIDASDGDRLKQWVNRSIDIIFGHPFVTPTREELGMYIAHAAGLRSAEPGRQVGAAIATAAGDIVAIGTNEVPAYKGGHYWSDPLNPHSPSDNREYLKEIDTSDATKRRLAAEIFEALKKSGAVGRALSDEAILEVLHTDDPERKKFATEAIGVLREAGAFSRNLSDDDIYGSLEATGLVDLTEYGRAVHGEMSALMDAARRGVNVSNETMYVTTFPCHQCSRHIVASGLERVVYIYPYPKSRAEELHGDAIEIAESATFDPHKVRYQSFIGVAPRMYPVAFAMTKRKDDETGKVVEAEDFMRSPRLPDEGPDGTWDVSAHVLREQKANETSKDWLAEVEVKVEAAMKEEQKSGIA